MARDRNVYVWQAYVTVMSIVSLACLGGMAFVIFQYGTNSKTVEAALDSASKANASFREESGRRQVLESMLGGKPTAEQLSTYGSDAQIGTAVKAYTTSMSLLGQSASERSYATLVNTLVQELRNRNVQIDTASKKELDLTKQYEERIASETKAREMEKKNALEAAKKLESETVRYAENVKAQQDAITKMEMEKQALVKSLQKSNQEMTSKFNEVTAAKADVTKRLDAVVTKLNEIQGEDFQYVQGIVTEVSNGGETVWINLGKSDGLKPGIKFGVLDSDISRVADAKPKAKIEVVEIINGSEHLARCKVLSDRAPTTILRGDSIYSPAWQPGRKVKFALVGKMDIDGDGRDDRDILKELIRQNGGEVTADLSPTAVLEGGLTVDTRWMVMGEDFQGRGADLQDGEKAYAKKRREMENEARAMAISRINLDKLMGWLRGSGVSEVSPLGSAMKAKASDFRAPVTTPNSTGRVSELFQTRDGRTAKPPTPPDAK